ncbi:MAG: hypothetical protein ABIG68_14235, partial [Acidobacteriota bacterium]
MPNLSTSICRCASRGTTSRLVVLAIFRAAGPMVTPSLSFTKISVQCLIFWLLKRYAAVRRGMNTRVIVPASTMPTIVQVWSAISTFWLRVYRPALARRVSMTISSP